MTLRLRCVRCGDWADIDPLSRFDSGVCGTCYAKFWGFEHLGTPYRRRLALWLRHRRNAERHPTYKALAAALEALESVPPGTLDASTQENQ